MASFALPATLRLPHPYLTTYQINAAPASASTAPSPTSQQLQIFHTPRPADPSPSRRDAQAPPQQLHSNVRFTDPQNHLAAADLPPENINTFWGRVRRSPRSEWSWSGSARPSLAQAWFIVYALFTLRPELEYFRLRLAGDASSDVAHGLTVVSLAVRHPLDSQGQHPAAADYADELVVLRGAFWQGAGSPFGSRPVWAPDTHKLASSGSLLSEYPPAALTYTISTKFPETRIHAFHPRRPQKPSPGSVIYSRYIPHLDEHFSIIALDHENEEHVQLFHKWQNDPRVAAGWNESGSIEHHRKYLRDLHEDAHTFTVLAKFDDTYFSYHEFYWAKEDHFGVYCDAGDFDRGRHSLVGDASFRGPHRISCWWSSLVHYLFLDEPRTLAVVGEPKAANDKVLSYDLMAGLSIQKFVDLPHKRSAFMRCSRERFFEICPLTWSGQRNVGGTGIKLFAKI